MVDKKRIFNKITRDIKQIKIQGARNIARAALYAYSLIQKKSSIKKLKSLRPTEPMLEKVLALVETKPYKQILAHFNDAQNSINKHVFKLIKDKDVIFTHCHSTNVSNALIYSKRKGKKFEVYNTETRPLFQGRKTAKELKNAKISMTMFIDSALGVALSGEQRKLNEIWDNAPKNIKIKNPAFEFVKKKYISGIITEFGLMKYGKFVRE